MTKNAIFEVTAAGFDGSTDETDHLVFWVVAASAAMVEEAINGTGATLCCEVTTWDGTAIDFYLPDDTARLVEALKAGSKAEKSVTVVFDAYGTSDFGGDAPSYAAVTVNSAFLSKLSELVAACKQHNLSEARIVSSPQWGPGDIEDELRLQCGELCITPSGSLHFTDYPKFGDYNIQSRGTSLSTLEKAFEDAKHGAVVSLSDDVGILDMYEEDQATEEDEAVAQS